VSLLGFLRRGRGDDAEVAVLGSGVPALAVALELARRSRRVSVLVRGEGASPAASLGLVALGPGRPYTRMVTLLGRDEARAVWAAGRRNLERVRSWLADSREDCGFEERGSFLLAADRAEAEALADSEDMLRDDGFPGEFLDHYMLETHFDVSGFPGAYWAADGAELDSTRLGPILAAAARVAGVRFHPAPVSGLEVGGAGVVVETEEGPVRAAAAVVATDAGLGRLVPALAPRLRPDASGRLDVPLEEGATLPSTARTGDGRVAWQVSGRRLSLAATGPASAGEGDEVLERLAASLPVRPGEASRWESPGQGALDGLPLIGVLPGQPVAVASGFGPAPVGLAFAAAAWIAEALATGADPTPAALRAGREPWDPGPV
jgi:glycine/D-amino acid oxidase-like deaminating enzyme